MGSSNRKIHVLIFLVAISAVLGFATRLASDDASGTAAILEIFVLPEYKQNKEGGQGKLQFILYGKKAVNLGATVDMQQVLIDMVRDDIKSIDEIKNLENVKIYPLNEKPENIRLFWKDKQHSKAIIETSKALYDKSTRIARGSEKVHFRSQLMDVDGVGFEGEYANQTVLIKSDVKVLIRSEAREKYTSDEAGKTPTATAAKKPEESKEPTCITSDTMNIDLVKNITIFTGNVVVDDPQMNITCQVMRVYMLDKEKEGGDKKESDASIDEGGKEISEIICEGNVVIVRKPDPLATEPPKLQKATAGKADYKLKTGEIVLTENPVITRAKDVLKGEVITVFRDSSRMIVKQRGEIKVNPDEEEKTGEKSSAPNEEKKK